MGWKALKEKFGIRHHVHVTSDGICIGSGYVPNLVTIEPCTGKVQENRTFPNFLRENYPSLLDAAPEELVTLIGAGDLFAAAIPVYTYEGGDIIEKQCEEPGWPNVTHDGAMMYENTFSIDKVTVVAWAKRNANLATEHTRDQIAVVERELATLRERLASYEADQVKLEGAYPTIEQAR
ncbi:hypothetical protein [Burkholderia sp. MBR-1]|uniref:hypothetical protein n=1 Tax=Burkholderia sp. MBR-1 TaxID=2732364 RepID=UPI0015EF3382|nr:hypothetical protein [Burkholderia sp. MBR-1]QMI49713.1 hypothetical protein MBR110_30005 [Burkholderia sp. MBR-1]